MLHLPKSQYGFDCIKYRDIISRSWEAIVLLNAVLVTPHLKYYVQFWLTQHKKDSEELEEVQRRVTKIVRDLEAKPYKGHLEELGLLSLQNRRLWGVMIAIFQYMKGCHRAESVDFLPVASKSKVRTIGGKL